MPDVSIFVAWTLLLLAGVWDAIVVPRFGLASGNTASWQLYADSRKWPVISLIAGVLLCWMTARTGASVAVVTFAFTCGHIFATMRGAK